jgi:hypothetical protein
MQVGFRCGSSNTTAQSNTFGPFYVDRPMEDILRHQFSFAGGKKCLNV